jgi:hypothetical protein
VIWNSDYDRSVLEVELFRFEPGRGHLFDLSTIDARLTVVPLESGGERVVLSNGLHRIGLTIVNGSSLSGPARARFRLDYRDGIDRQILTLRRLSAILETGRFSNHLFKRERMAPRWVDALRAHDAAMTGASQREIAAVVFAGLAAADVWRGDSDFLRLRVQRLLRSGRAMVAGAYRSLLR